MKKKNLKLENLKVNSFTTSSADQLKGGNQRTYELPTNDAGCAFDTVAANNCPIPISQGCNTVLPGQFGFCQ